VTVGRGDVTSRPLPIRKVRNRRRNSRKALTVNFTLPCGVYGEGGFVNRSSGHTQTTKGRGGSNILRKAKLDEENRLKFILSPSRFSCNLYEFIKVFSSHN
jgi:hypothetical protein